MLKTCILCEILLFTSKNNAVFIDVRPILNKNTWKKFTILFIFIFIPGTRCTGSNEALHFAQKTVGKTIT